MGLIPNLDPPNLGSLEGLLNQFHTYLLRNFDTALPAIVESYDPAANRARVRCPIYIKDTANTRIKRPPIASVPVVRFGGGGFFISAPLAAGDTGWVIACDRDIFNYLTAQGKDTVPATTRVKTFSDSFFIPDNLFTSMPVNPGALCIQSEDGKTSIQIAQNQITISSLGIELNGDLVCNGDVQIEGKVAIKGGLRVEGAIEGKVAINGELRVEGNITASGDIIAHVPS